MRERGMMDGWHGDEPEIEAEANANKRDYDEDSIFGLIASIKQDKNKIESGAKEPIDFSPIEKMLADISRRYGYKPSIYVGEDDDRRQREM